MESLATYNKLAKAICLKQRLPNHHDVIGEIASAIMTADHKYNPDIGTLAGYRQMYIKFTIQNIRKALRKNNMLSIDENFDCPDERLELKDESDILKEIKESKLTDREKQIVEMKYWKNMKGREIAAFFGVSKQAVLQTLQNAEEKLRVILANHKN